MGPKVVPGTKADMGRLMVGHNIHSTQLNSKEPTTFLYFERVENFRIPIYFNITFNIMSYSILIFHLNLIIFKAEFMSWNCSQFVNLLKGVAF
jgi:hypothetical protein